MMTPTQFVEKLLAHKKSLPLSEAKAFAPINIALCKYWGKRDSGLNLPMTSSLSLTLPNLGSTTKIKVRDTQDIISLNGKIVDNTQTFAKKIIHFLNLFRDDKIFFKIETENNIPTSAGLASSASGFAALTLALNDLFAWQLSQTELSLLARLGSGSACRSFWPGFVEWKAGVKEDGSDSFGVPILANWPDLRVGVVLIHKNEKPISSRDAMQITKETSPLYAAWPQTVSAHLIALKKAISELDFHLLGKTSEHNALCMHATMMAAWPSVLYASAETFKAIHTVWHLRKEGLEIYFTQDAGPHLKLLFLAKDTAKIMLSFPEILVVEPFS